MPKGVGGLRISRLRAPDSRDFLGSLGPVQPVQVNRPLESFNRTGRLIPVKS